jgi:hypothetical protein
MNASALVPGAILGAVVGVAVGYAVFFLGNPVKYGFLEWPFGIGMSDAFVWVILGAVAGAALSYMLRPKNSN